MATEIDLEKLNDKTQMRKYDQTAPPLKPMVHQEYPKTMYLWAKDKSIHPLHGNMLEKDATGEFVSVTDFSRTDPVRVKIANDPDEEAKLIAKGYRDKPHTQKVDEPVPAGFEPDLPAPATPAKAATGDKDKKAN